MKKETDLIDGRTVLTIYLIPGRDYPPKITDQELGQFIEELKRHQWIQYDLREGDEIQVFVDDKEETYATSY